MPGLGFSIPTIALRRFVAAEPPLPGAATVDRTTTTVDSTLRTIDRS